MSGTRVFPLRDEGVPPGLHLALLLLEDGLVGPEALVLLVLPAGGRLDLLVDVVGGEHLADDLLLDGVHLALGVLDLVEEGGVFLVGLDLAQLALELGDLDLDVLDRRLEVPPRLLVRGELLLGVGDGLGAGLDLPVDVLDEAGDVFEEKGRLLDLGIEVLELDQFVEVDFHIVLKSGGPTRIRTWDLPVMSR